MLGAERSHPESMYQAALYTYSTFNEACDAVVATMDTGSRVWDFEVIPAERVERAFEQACERLGQLDAHYVLHGADPETLPERDFQAGGWQCKRCPFLNTCLPGMAAVAEPEEEAAEETEPVTDEEARSALHEYEEIQDTLREFENEKRWALDKLRAWLGQWGGKKAKLEGREKIRTVGMVKTTRYSVDHKKLNALLGPEIRAGIVTENLSEYLRVS